MAHGQLSPHIATFSLHYLTGAVHRFPEEVREGDAAYHDVLLLELDQRLFRYQTADGVQAPENVQDNPRGPRGLGVIGAGGLTPPPEEEPLIAGPLEVVFLLDGFLVVPAYFGQPSFDIVPDLRPGHAKLVGDGLLGRPGHLHLDNLLASLLRDYLVAVL